MKDRTIQTVIANVSLTVVIVVVAIHRPDVPILAPGLPALLAVNGYEAVRQVQNGQGKP